MALIFNVTHTVTFGTFAGEEYQWELDLLRSYDDSEATPSWASDPTVQVTATNSPIEVEWMSDSDVYKPIMASRAKIALHKIAGDYLPRFTSAGQFEYQARLRYRRNGESTLNDYWCGFIQSSEGSESVSSTNPTTTFTAIDNLGGMEDTTVDISVDSTTSINLFDKVLEAIRQTGLDLPVLVDSGIRNSSGEALTDVTAHPYSLFTSDEDNVNVEYRKKLTSKNMIEGLLSAFNCRVFQSYGNWFIVNASTHGGTGVNETATFDKYTVTNEVYGIVGTESFDLLYNIGGNTPDLLVANSDLQLNTKRPFGSVECRPKNVRERNYSANGLLQSGTEGYDVEPTSADQTLTRTVLGLGTKHPTAKHALSTSRSRFRLDTLGTVWFKSEPMTVDVNAPIDISFDWMATDKNESVAMNFAAVITTSNLVVASSGYVNTGTFYNLAQEANFTYNFANGEWNNGTRILSDYKVFASVDNHHSASTTSEINEWQTVEETLSPATYYDAATNDHTVLDGTLTIYWFYPRSKRSGRSRNEGSDVGDCTVLLTNVGVQSKYSNDITKPVYERVQANYTKTERYEPYFADNLPTSVYNRIEQEGFRRKDDLVSTVTTLERIVTQQKLNDNRDEFRFYEGNFINISSDPIAPHHKLKMDWNNYTEAETLIFKGGTYQPKDGQFDMSHYAPNQSTDIAPNDGFINNDGTVTPGFYEYDVDLVADDFTGRSGKVTYSLALVPEGIDEFGALLTTNPLTIEDIPNGVLQITGNPGSVTNHVVKISVDDNFEASASNMSFFDGTNQGTGIWQLLEDGEDTAEQVSNLTFRDLGSELEIVFDIELPERSEFEQLRMAGEVDPRLEGNVDFDLTFALDSGITNAVINNTTRNLRGVPGTSTFVNVVVTPAAGKQLDASLFTTSSATGVTVSSIEQMGTSVYLEVQVEFQADDASESITIFGSSGTDLPDDLTTSTVSLTLSESIGNVSLSRTSLTLTGVVGTTAVYDITTYAADGFALNAGNFSAVESEAWLSVDNAVGGGETVLLPLEITFPAADASGTVTISGSAQAAGADTISITVNFTNSVANSSLIDSSEVFILNHGQRISYTNTLTPTKGFFMDASSLTITETVDTNNVVAFTASDAGGGSINMSTSIVAPSTGSSVSADIELTGSVSAEPYLATVNLTETLPLGRITQNTLSQRFGTSDSNVVFTGLTVSPTSEDTGYVVGTTLTVTGGVAGNYTYANGNITFDLTVPLPIFSSSLPIGNTAIDVVLSSASAPIGLNTVVKVNASGLRNCDVTLQGADDLDIKIPFSATSTTITVVASGISGATFNTQGMNQPVFASNNAGMSSTGTQSSSSFTATFTLPAQTSPSTVIITLNGGADVDAQTVNGLSLVIGAAPASPAINTIYFS